MLWIRESLGVLVTNWVILSRPERVWKSHVEHRRSRQQASGRKTCLMSSLSCWTNALKALTHSDAMVSGDEEKLLSFDEGNEAMGVSFEPGVIRLEAGRRRVSVAIVVI